MNRLCEIARKRVRIVVGLMSGTSHDGVDAAVAEIKGSGAGCRVRLLSHSRMPYPKALRERVRAAFEGDTALVSRLNFELGGFFAKAALKAIGEAGLKPSGVDVIGSHGQTIFHEPPREGRPGSTLQVGEGAVIARRTGVVTVSDFRTADVAVGGHGAPLVPVADWILFHEKGRVTALQNIGGISNVTVVTEKLKDVMGFDTGPGCSLLDEAASILSGGKLKLDKNGNMAKSGKLLPDLFDKLISNPYFMLKPPKSTGRETFGRAMAERIIKGCPGAKKEDILHTLTHLTARSIHDAYRRHVLPERRVDRVVIAGGGANNRLLVSLLSELFERIPVVCSDALGVPVMAREALCFAVLANETISGNPGNAPSATGARQPAVLGKISI